MSRSAALLFEESRGFAIEAPSLAQAEALGALFGRFHAATVRAVDRRWRIDADTLGRTPLRAVEGWLQRTDGDVARETARRLTELERVVNAMADIAFPDGASLPMGLCHGDLRTCDSTARTRACSIWSGSAPARARMTSRATGASDSELASPDAEPPRAEWEALLRGYEQTRTLTPLERQAIPALATLRADWVMSLPATPGTTWGQDWLLDPEYIDSHVAMIERLASVARAGT